MAETLYEHAGGMPAFLALAHAHHARCLADPELNHPFSHPGGNPQHIERLAAYWAQVLGGPPGYTDDCAGDQTALLLLHAGNGDMSDLGRRFVVCFRQAMDDAGLPADSDFRDAMLGYMRWAVADVLAHRDPTSIPAGATLPRWGWNGLEPAS